MSRAAEPPVRVLFVCLGNICRSPTAEGVFRALVAREGLADRVHIDSAGTGAWHIGQPPDARSQAAARRRGLDLSDQRARQVHERDLHGEGAFDFIVAMDSSNLRALRSLARGEERAAARLRLLLRDYAPHAGPHDVPDPYHAADGETEGFDRVLDLIEQGCEGLLADVRQRLRV